MRQGYSAATDRASSDIDSRYIVEDGDLLFSWSGSLLARFWAEGLGALNQHLFKVTSRYYPEWFYYSWLQHHMPEFQLIAAGKATTMGHIQRHHLSAALCLVPSKELLNEMTNIIQPWIKQEVINSIQMNQLGRVRDLLLPKLMTQQCLLSNGLILRN
jgi:type I restriction enzyme S subunit